MIGWKKLLDIHLSWTAEFVKLMHERTKQAQMGRFLVHAREGLVWSSFWGGDWLDGCLIIDGVLPFWVLPLGARGFSAHPKQGPFLLTAATGILIALFRKSLSLVCIL